MAHRMTGNLLLVGSVPLDTSEEVLRLCGRMLGDHVSCLPDGEVGDRIWWVPMLGYRVFNGHPQLETIHRPPDVDGVENWKPHGPDDFFQFRVKPGVQRVRFGHPGERLVYAREAINSYFVFRTLRDQGVIAKGVRFQVCLPMTVSALSGYFREPGDFEKVAPGFEEAMQAEIEAILRKIPPEDLAIQWDTCIEVLAVEGFQAPGLSRELETNVAAFGRLSPRIPEEALLGYHFCYGTLGGWPMITPKDLSVCVRFANEATRRSGRRVDFVHMPVPRHRFDDAYYAPLRDIESDDLRVYVGLIHHPDTEAELRRRIVAARRARPDIGLASVCGFGRMDPSAVPAYLEDHRRAVAILREK